MASNLTQQQLAQIRQLWKLDARTLEDLVAGGAEEKYRPQEQGLFFLFDRERTGSRSRYTSTVRSERGATSKRAIVARFAEKLAMKFKKLLCRDLRYCERSKSEGLALAIAVADSLVTATVMIPVPVTAISVYLVRRGILDRVCRCAKKRKRRRA
jgi:hypothetical protein